jgi:hypothetical protein
VAVEACDLGWMTLASLQAACLQYRPAGPEARGGQSIAS